MRYRGLWPKEADQTFLTFRAVATTGQGATKKASQVGIEAKGSGKL
jgi:hypothetical protein